MSSDLSRLSGNVGAAVVLEELQGVSLGNALDVTEALINRLDEYLAYRLARQALAFSSPVGQDLPIAAIFREGHCHDLT